VVLLPGATVITPEDTMNLGVLAGIEGIQQRPT
jgi:hypothetical protein